MYQLKRTIVLAVFVLASLAGSMPYASAQQQQQRLALVIGQSAYDGRQLATAANDAGLIAQTLTSAGFEVVQGRDLNANDLRSVVRDFLDKAQALEGDAAIMVYLSGFGIQLEGENYLLPVDARIQRDVDVPIEGFRLSDLVRSLERTPAQARIIVADMARDYPLPTGSDPIARGLALMEPPAGYLIAFSSAPNITSSDAPGPYGHYATALVEMMRQPGVPVDEVFNRVRLRTHETTKGLQTPWHKTNLGNTPFVFFEPEESAAVPPPVREVRRIEEVPAEEAYHIAVERDTIQDYQAFLRRYPDHPLARRVSALLAARREAIVWRQTVNRNTSEAYWTYLRRYPNGPHAADCRRRLARLSAPVAPPPVFEEVVYEDLPPPLPVVETVEVVEVVTIIREVPPPPPPPVYLLPAYEEDVEFVTIIREPPPPPILVGVLPIPAPIPVPRYARPPRSFYEPIAPVTPRGPVAIPVLPPRIASPRGPTARELSGAPDAPRFRPSRGLRPEPVVPRQPGLAAQPQPIPVAARPAPPRAPTARELSGVPDAPRIRQPRLPSRPIPVPTAARPEADRPAPAAPGAAAPVAPRPTPPVPSASGRPPAADERQDETPRPSLPAAPRLGRPPVPSARDVPDTEPRALRPGIEQDRPSAARPARPDVERDRPSAVRPPRFDTERERPAAPRPPRLGVEQERPAASRLLRPEVDDDRLDGPRRLRPTVREEERPRPPRPAAQPRPEPRIEVERPVQPARPRVPQVRPEPEFRPAAPRVPRARPEPEFRPAPEPREIRPPRPMVQPRPAAPEFRPAPPAARPQPAAPAFRPAPPRVPSARPQPERPSAPEAAPRRRGCQPGRPCPQD
ncbi:caspase-like domain-containing protein [Microvirga sp. KLBC 81]|uniref:caspase family protein n=1 Tax=Microvirga sp. KLBC 81 TaxID=1862707 RepID=UPI000D50F54C|nr:caspase family protein [Microvirga sp. KLBC 81]PVE25593.1 caspase-like domain-containing protein [Microvirga sp. KLBC 81]